MLVENKNILIERDKKTKQSINDISASAGEFEFLAEKEIFRLFDLRNNVIYACVYLLNKKGKSSTLFKNLMLGKHEYYEKMNNLIEKFSYNEDAKDLISSREIRKIYDEKISYLMILFQKLDFCKLNSNTGEFTITNEANFTRFNKEFISSIEDLQFQHEESIKKLRKDLSRFEKTAYHLDHVLKAKYKIDTTTIKPEEEFYFSIPKQKNQKFDRNKQ